METGKDVSCELGEHMQIIQQTTEFIIKEKTAAALGKFDGIHRGHQKLLEEILEQKKKGLKAVIFTFDPSPATLFQKSKVKELSTKKEKEALFEEMGVDILIEFPLNEKTAAMSAEDFIEDVLVKKMNVGFIAAGTDLSFGYQGAGNAKLLKTFSEEYGFQVEIIDKVCHEGREISSSYVREEIEKGNMELAAALIGKTYSISGVVEHGNRIGRTLGFPTVNLLPEKEKLLPPCGVYFSKVFVDKEVYDGVTNIGYKPTVSEESRIGVETFIYDFEKDVYGKEITVSLEHFRRSEQKFSDLEQLKAQVDADKEAGVKFHQK